MRNQGDSDSLRSQPSPFRISAGYSSGCVPVRRGSTTAGSRTRYPSGTTDTALPLPSGCRAGSGQRPSGRRPACVSSAQLPLISRQFAHTPRPTRASAEPRHIRLTNGSGETRTVSLNVRRRLPSTSVCVRQFFDVRGIPSGCRRLDRPAPAGAPGRVRPGFEPSIGRACRSGRLAHG